jgi:hypothetical protein
MCFKTLIKFLFFIVVIVANSSIYSQNKAQSHLLFVNGYKLTKHKHKKECNLIKTKKKYWYWSKLDKTFLGKIKPDFYYYADGSFSIKTSNHLSFIRFCKSFYKIKSSHKKQNNFEYLNTKSNQNGFDFRKNTGKNTGQYLINNFLQKNTIKDSINFDKKDTIHFVCHSMGYAYTLGIIEKIIEEKTPIVFGKIYIIAPENAMAGNNTNWEYFQEVWQIGSNLNTAHPDPVWKQDGVAPQSSITGISKIQKGGNLHFPDTIKTGFFRSHLPINYFWIFQNKLLF